MAEYTPSQRKAIETKNVSLVVSAGAGSGKTTVMTQRILDSLLEGNDINRFLVVTYTKSAADDIKDKLYRRLSEAQAKDPKNKHIPAQIASLSAADISTVHGFCFSRIKRSFPLLGITPDIRAADETESAILQQESMEKALNDGFEKGEKWFLELADAFCDRRSDRRFAENMLHLYKELRVYPYPHEFLQERIAQLEKECKNTRYSDTEICKSILNETRECLMPIREKYMQTASYLDTDGHPELAAQLYWFANNVDTLLSVLDSGYTPTRECIRSITNPSLKGKADPQVKEWAKNIKNKLNDEIKEISKRFFMHPETTHMEDLRETLSLLKATALFLKEFEDIYVQAKKKARVIDFSDQEHMMLSLLEKDGMPTELCLEMRDGFDEIYVDEYQDTNPLQDRIFTLLSKNNRFMVGDVKQSIYRFRSAHPDIFNGYCHTYGTEQAPCTRKVLLRENFRCDEKIIEFCNRVFSAIPEISDRMNYSEESLAFSKIENNGNAPVEFTVIIGGTEMDAEQKQTAEANYIVSRIKELIGTPKNDGTPYGYGDIAILFAALTSNISVYTRVFRRAGIPFRCEKSENFLDRQEILLAIAALKSVDNPTSDIPLASIMRSPLFDFTADELFKIRSCSHSERLYDCVLAAAAVRCDDRAKGKRYTCNVPFEKLKAIKPTKFKTERSLISRSLCTKCKKLLTQLSSWRNASEGTPAHRFIWQMYNESGIINAALSRPDGKERYRNLMLLYDYARRYEESSYKGLSAFLLYLDETSSLDEAKTPDDGGNTVKLMTIHKSKGLEFPAVFLADSDREFKKSGSASAIVRKDGIGFKFSRHNGMLTKGNCVLDSLAIKELSDQTAEEARKLYVALTRARERLFVIAKSTKLEDLGGNLRTGTCHADWIAESVGTESTPYCRFDTVFAEEIPDIRQKAAQAVYAPPDEDIKGRLEYCYGKSGCDVPQKISVSEIRPGLLEEQEYRRTVKHGTVLRKPSFLGISAASAADKGTANHLFMQFASFEGVEKNGVKEEAKRLYEKGFITLQQLELINTESLAGFFSSPLYRRMKESDMLCREKRFSVQASDTVVGGKGDESILVQGVIDCFFRNPDGTFTVVDYKTDRVTREKELVERHKVQIDFYRTAVEKMTGKKVSAALIYSFALGKEIPV